MGITMRKTALAVLVAALSAVSAAAQVAPPPTVPPGTQQAPPVQQPPAAQPPAAPTPSAAGSRVEIIEQILVKVNGEIITKTELENRQVAALRTRAQQMSDDDLKKAIASITPDILVETVDELLLLQRGKELGYKVTDENFKRVLENIRKENKLESDDQFNAALKQEGITIEQLRKNLEKQMVINQVQQQEVAGKVGISESEAQAYYAEHKNEFTTPASLTLRELLVAVKLEGKTINVAADDAAKAKAEGLVKRARAGEPFATLVAEASDAPSKANGGLVGPLSAEELDPGVRKLIEGMKPGGVTDVFRTGGGYALIQLDTSTPPVVKSFEAARDDIAQKVYEGKRNAEFQRYLAKLRSDAIIDWKNEEMHKMWLSRTTALAPPPAKNPGL
jgi:parvulin-like peptidyl-prolyl isomerase